MKIFFDYNFGPKVNEVNDHEKSMIDRNIDLNGTDDFNEAAVDDSINMAGVKGEGKAFWDIMKMVKKFPAMKIYHNKIIPVRCDDENRTDRESDIICIGERKIFVFEIKYLKGKITADNKTELWKQYSQKFPDGKEIKNGFEQVNKCGSALREFLVEKGLIDNCDDIIDSKVIFACDNFDDSNLCGFRFKNYIMLKNARSYIFLNDIKGASFKNRNEIITAVESLKNMCIVSLKNEKNIIGNIYRGDILNNISYNLIEAGGDLKNGNFEADMLKRSYLKIFCNKSSIIDIAALKYIKIYKRFNNAFIAEALFKGCSELKKIVIFNDVIMFKPRGQKQVLINMDMIDQIAFS